MAFNVTQDWLVLVIIGLFVAFVVYAYFNGRKNTLSSRDKEQGQFKKRH